MTELLNTFRDSSGLITVGVFANKGAPAQHHTDAGADIPDQWVVVGGGARGVRTPEGALLTASYPSDGYKAWLASSKDHLRPQEHVLTTYAIGMQIEGMSRRQLMDHLHVDLSESVVAPHPEATATVPDGFVLLGGGFRIDWSGAGSLATASYPSSDRSWTARAKDHIESSPASIASYAISIAENLPVGRVDGRWDSEDSEVAAHPSAAADVPHGYALTGGGADVHWRGTGNLLWRLEPRTTTGDQGFSASSKDHRKPDPASLTAYAIGLRIV